MRSLLGLHYFVFFAAMGAYFPYMPAWMKARGLSGFQIGVITALLPAMAVLSPPMTGMLADALGVRGGLMRVCAAAGLLALGVLSVSLVFEPSVSFGFLFLCIFAFTFFRSPVSQLADVVTLEHAGSYGRIRVWGSIGFMISTPLIGRYVALEPAHAIPVACAAGFSCVLVVSFFLPKRTHLGPAPVLSEARRLLNDRGFRWLLLSAALGQASHAAYDLWVTIHLQNLGASGTTAGVAWAIATSGEVVVLIVSPWLFRRASIPGWLVVALGAAVLRWALLASVTDVETILVSQPLHGLTFGLRWVCYLTLVRSFAAQNTMATAQGLFLGCFSLGGVAGMLLWGSVYDVHGGTGVFTGAAVVGLLSILVTLPIVRLEQVRRRTALV